MKESLVFGLRTYGRLIDDIIDGYYDLFEQMKTRINCEDKSFYEMEKVVRRDIRELKERFQHVETTDEYKKLKEKKEEYGDRVLEYMGFTIRLKQFIQSELSKIED